jgi:RimJ/RimL family protein N-acetyltransferase
VANGGGAPVTDDLALLDLQIATLFRLDAAGNLLAINEPDDRAAPRLFLGRTTAGNRWRLRHDLPAALRDELARILATEPRATDLAAEPVTATALRAALAVHAPVANEWSGPAWVFPEVLPATEAKAIILTEAAPLRRTFPGWAADFATSQPGAAILQGGEAVAVCFSSRTSARAAEAGANTLREWRGRGYARAAVCAWAGAVLYSTSWDNLASRGVARSLGLRLYAADFHLT